MSHGTIRNRRNELNARGEEPFYPDNSRFRDVRGELGRKKKKKVKAIHGDSYLLLIKREPCRYRERSDRVNHRLEGNLLWA